MKIVPREGYVLVSKQEMFKDKKEKMLILTSEDKKKVYLRVESNGNMYRTGDCVFAQPFSTRMEIEENLFLIEEKDIVATFIIQDR